ncbi:hypothetical protein BBJ28_00019661 [Nothophytophthora sp. Chile5]|nr:hypothetical protein BBJ28_00019661 [Nothophytophthora sp. Chile5]
MGGASGIEPRRLALRYAPPGIIVEYVYHAKPTTALSPTRQLYHHEINLEEALSMPRASAISVSACRKMRRLSAVARKLGRLNRFGAVVFNRVANNQDERLAELVRNLIIQHAEVLGDSKVSSNQLVRLIKKLAAYHLDTQTPLPPATAAPVLPQADYNSVSETQLKVVKQKMDLVFEQNLLRPGQDGFQYDKQVAFQPAVETSDWDDE